MRLITKLWTTLLLLCVAGVANAATEYEVDQKFTTIAELDGKSFAIVDETPTTPTAMGIGISGHGQGWDMYFGTITEAYNSNTCFYKLEAVTTEGLEGNYYLRTYKADGTMYTAWGDASSMGYFNSQKATESCCFALGLSGQNGQDGPNLAVWKIEVSEGKFALKNIGTGQYLHADNLPAKYDDAFYFTFCTLKEKAQTDPLADQKDALTAAIAKGKMINALAYTDATFATLTAKVADGETALAAADATAESLTTATTAINDAITALALKDGFTSLKDVDFGVFDGWGATAKLTQKLDPTWDLFKATGQSYGDPSVNNRADVSAYDKLYVVAVSGTPRILLNRDVADGQWNEDEAQSHLIDNTKGGWSAKYFTTENVIVTVDLKQLTADKGFAHLTAIKSYDNNVISGLYLYKAPAVDPDADTLPIDIQFGSTYNDKSVQNYTSTWTATKDGKTWSLVNFNNNQNGWNSVKCGRKDYTSVASIASPAINAVVKSYVISLTKASNVNSAKLAIMNGENLVGDSINITEKFVAGDVVVPVEGQKGYSYVLIIDNKSAGSNGSVEISKITLAGETIEPIEPTHIANTAETAYTIAKAIELIDAGEALSDTVFVKGIVSKVDEYSEQYKNITYWISDDGTTESAQFECFRGKNINGADFAAIEDVEVGAEVIVKGTLKKYNDTYELNQGNELVSYKAPFKPLFADGKYYVYNVGTQKYLAAGSNWGTHAVVNATGLDYNIKAADGKYTLDSQVSNGGANNFLNGEWNDGAAFGWTIAKVSDGIFTISDGTKFLTAGENGVVTLADDAAAEAAHWTMKTLDERLATLATATTETPVDATFLIQDADFGRNDLRKSAWKMEASNQNLSGGEDGNGTVGNNNAESYHSTFTLSQTLSKAPAGKYKMTAQGFYRQDDNATEDAPVFYANEKTGTFPAKTGSENSMTDAAKSFSAGQYTIDSIDVTVFEDGLLTIGAKGTATHQWVIFDNFRLTYLGNAIDLTEIIASYNKALEDAKAALAAEENAIVTGEERTALTAAIAANENVAQNQDSLTAAVTALSNATSAFTGAKGAYNALATAKTEKAAMTFAYAAADKKAAAEATLTAEATSAADATAKVEAITKAYRVYAESSALLEGVEGAINLTDSIKNPKAENEVNNWTTVLGEGSGGSIGIRDNEPWTDGADNATHKYFDGGNWGAQAWDVTLEQKIALPKGKYQLTVKSRAAGDVAFTLFAGNDSTAMPAIGASNGLFNRGWNDASVEFELTEADSIAIGVRGVTTKQYNWMSFSDFRLMQFPAEVEVAHTWDFTKWSEATVANLKADAAASKLEGWSDVEKQADAEAGNEPTETSKDNCFWAAKTMQATEDGELLANGVAIEELKGLVFLPTGLQTRNLAIAVNYPVALSTYEGGAYLWLGGSDKDYFVIPNVKAGTTIKMGVESHKTSDARGVRLYMSNDGAKGDQLKDPEGNEVAMPKTYEEQSWKVPGEEGVVNIIVNNSNGCHIYFIDAEIGETTVPEDPELEVAEGWHSVIENGNLATDNVANFFIKENGGDPMPAVIVAGAGKNGSRGIVINTPNDPTYDWDAQFFIQANENIPAGYKIHVEFDYMATQEAAFDTQSHAEPGNYIHWYCIDSYTANTEWQHMSKEVEVSAATQDTNGNWNGEWGKACDASEGGKPFKTIGFNLSKVKTATAFHFDNITFWVTDVATGIVNVKNEKNNDVIYNLNGLKVNKAQKGLYIINGKKVVIK